MTDVNMPEPKGQRLAYRCVAGYGEDEYEDFYTEAQMKQYGDDRAREALEMAAESCENAEIVTYIFAGQLYDSGAETLGRAIDDIRALAKEIK